MVLSRPEVEIKKLDTVIVLPVHCPDCGYSAWASYVLSGKNER
jgi:hypothetical protein